MYFLFGSTLVVIFLMVNTVLFQMMEFIIDKQVPFSILIKILFYQLPAYAVLAFPMASLLSTLISINRLSKDSEIDVMRTSGISVIRMMVPMLIMGLLVSAFSFLMLQKLVPWSNNKSAKLWRQFNMSDVMKKPVEDVIFKGKGKKHFCIKEIDPKTDTIVNVTIYDTKEGGYPKIINAPSGIWNDENLILKNGTIIHFNKNGNVDYEAKFEEMVINIEREMQEIFGEQKTPQEMTIQELKSKITLLKESGIDSKRLETDLQFKLSIPIANLICVLVGVPLSIRTGRNGMIAGILLCAAIVILYWVGTIVSTALGQKGVLPPIVAAWSQNFLFLFVGIILIIRTRK